MKPWIKWSLIIGTPLLLFTGYLLLRPKKRKSSDNDDDNLTAVFTPSLGPENPAGLTNFPDEAPQGTDFFSLLDYMHELELGDRELSIQDQTDDTLRDVWESVNKSAIKAGTPLQKVCITASGGIGIGEQCRKSRSPIKVYSGQ